MGSHIRVAWRLEDEEPEDYDFECLICGDVARVHPGDGFVVQVRIFFEQHQHKLIDPYAGDSSG